MIDIGGDDASLHGCCPVPLVTNVLTQNMGFNNNVIFFYRFLKNFVAKSNISIFLQFVINKIVAAGNNTSNEEYRIQH